MKKYGKHKTFIMGYNLTCQYHVQIHLQSEVQEGGHPTWMAFMLVPADAVAINPQNTCQHNQGVGILQQSSEQGLNIDAWAHYIVHHGQPGL